MSDLIKIGYINSDLYDRLHKKDTIFSDFLNFVVTLLEIGEVKPFSEISSKVFDPNSLKLGKNVFVEFPDPIFRLIAKQLTSNPNSFEFFSEKNKELSFLSKMRSGEDLANLEFKFVSRELFEIGIRLLPEKHYLDLIIKYFDYKVLDRAKFTILSKFLIEVNFIKEINSSLTQIEFAESDRVSVQNFEVFANNEHIYYIKFAMKILENIIGDLKSEVEKFDLKELNRFLMISSHIWFKTELLG